MGSKHRTLDMSSGSPKHIDSTRQDDQIATRRRRLSYLISLPERGLRSTGALAGGLFREVSQIVIPASFRRTKLYRSLVETSLRFVIEQVGKVEKADTLEPPLPSDFALRRSAGNGIEILGILLFRTSPRMGVGCPLGLVRCKSSASSRNLTVASG
jgi:hypothetical protein